MERTKPHKNISSIGPTWEEVRGQIFTKEEIAESDSRVALIGKLVRPDKNAGFSSKKIEESTAEDDGQSIIHLYVSQHPRATGRISLTRMCSSAEDDG